MPDRQSELRDFVHHEVYVNQSSLVDTLLAKGLADWDEIDNLYSTCLQRGDDPCQGCQLGEDCEESEPQEVFEWWMVSGWLVEKLREHDEPILDTDMGTWWGRTTTGQAIYLDNVIKDIYDLLQRSQ